MSVIYILPFPDNPSQVSRVLVAVETLDLNDNAPELDRQYTTALCDSSNAGQVSMSFIVKFNCLMFDLKLFTLLSVYFKNTKSSFFLINPFSNSVSPKKKKKKK